MNRTMALRYALAPLCVGVAVLLHLSPLGPYLHPTGLFLLAVVAAAWFGGAGPGVVAATVATFALPQLIAMSYPLAWGFFDLPRFVTFSITGFAVGWGATRRESAEATLRERERELTKARDELEAAVAERTAHVTASEERYARAMEATAAGHWEWDLVNHQVFHSPRFREIYGIPVDEKFADRDAWKARQPVSPRERARQEQALQAAIADPTKGYDIELSFEPRPGEVRWVRSRGKVFRAADGTPLRISGATTDITAQKLAQEALRESEQRYERVMLAAEAGFWDWDVPADEFYVSPKLLEMTDFPPGTRFAGRADFMARAPFHPGDRTNWERAVKDLFVSGGARLAMEIRSIHGGETRWALLSGLCVRDSAGKVVRWTGSATDVTARKHAEMALRQSDERHARVMQASEDGFWEWIVATDEFYASPRMLALYELPPDTVFRGRADFLSRFPFHPEDLESWRKAVAAHLAGDTARVDVEVRAKVKSKTRWLHLTAICQRDRAGAEERWTGSVSDVTERRRAQEALRVSEERYARAMEGSDAGHWDWNIVSDEMFVSERAREMLALPAGELPPRRSEIMALAPMHPDDRAAMNDAVSTGIQSGIHERDYRILPRPGEVRWLRTRARVYKDASGAAVRMTGSLIDITERKLAADALRASEQRYSLAMEASDEGHFDFNVETGELFISERLNEIYGFAPGTRFENRNAYLKQFRFFGNDAETYHAAVRAAEAKGGPERYEFEYRIVRASGEMRWLRTRGKVLRDTSGRALRRTGVVADITDAKVAEQALLQSQERYALAMEAAGDGHTDWNLVTGEFYISPRLLEILGYAPGTTFTDRADWVRRFPFHPEDRTRWEAAVAAHFAGREAKFRMDLRIVVNSETRWVAFTFIATRDASGKPVRWTGSIADIHDAKVAEQALHESRERYALAVAGSDDGIWDCDFAFRRVFVSARARELAGMPPGPELLSMDEWFSTLPLHPDDVPRRIAAMESHLAGETPAYVGEFRLLQRDGVYRWRRIHGLCVRDANGNPDRMAGSISDIDARKRAEGALRLSEERYALALEASEEGHFDTDVQTGEMFVSARLNEIYGFPRQSETVDRVEFLERIPIHPDDRHRFAGILRPDWEDRTQDFYEFECRIVPRPGETRWIHSRAKVVRDADGRARRRVGVVADITARKHAEEALRLSEERYTLAVAGASDGIWDEDLATGMLYRSPRNQEMALGRPSDGIDVRRRAEWAQWHYVHPDDAPKRDAARRAHLEGRTPLYEIEYRVRHQDGTYHWIQARGVCTRDASGRPLRFAGSTSDIDARKAAEDALRLSEERYALAMEAAQDAHWDWIVGTEQYYTSPRVVDVFGLPAGTTFTSREDYLAKTPLLKEDLEVWVGKARELFAGTGSRLSMDLRAMIHGEIRWIQHNGVCFRDASGRAVRWCGSVRDVTERRRAEEALRLSEKRYALAMEVADEGHFDWNVQTDEIFASARALSVVGVPPDAKCRTRSDVMTHVRYHPDDDERIRKEWRAALDGRGVDHEFEYRILRGEVEEPRWVRGRWKVFRDEAGVALRVVGIVTDITEAKLAREALRLSEERYARAMEASEEGHFDWNVRTDEIFASTHLKRVLGLPADAVHRTRGDMVAHMSFYPGDREHVAGIARDVLAGSALLHEFEYRLLRGQAQEPRWIRARWKIFRDAAGVAQRVIGVVSDITERKLAADELRESEARFRALTELSSDWYWEQDENLRFTYLSNQALQLTGYSGESSLGKTRWEIANMTPLTCSWAEHQAVLAAREPFRDLECRRVGADGTVRYLSMSGAPIFDAQGRFRGYRGIGRNITARKAAAEAVRESEARFRSLTELSSDWYWEQDENLRFTYTSRQAGETTSYPSEWVIGKTRWELPGITPLSFTWPEHQAVLAARQSFRDLEYARSGRDGTRYVSISGAPVFDEQGVFRGYQGIGRDITERKRVEEELRSRQEMLDLAQKSARAVPWEWRNGAEPKVNQWSPELCAMFGLPPGGFDGTAAHWWRLCHPKDWSRVKSAVAQTLVTGDIDLEYRVTHPDGKVRWLNQKGRAFFGAERKPVRSIGFMYDVTERKQAEEALRLSEAFLREGQKMARVGNFVWRVREGDITWSEEIYRIFGFEPGSRITLEQIATRVHPDDIPMMRDMVERAQAGVSTFEYEHRVVMPDGSHKHVHLVGHRTGGEEDRVEYIGAVQDITERKGAETALRQSEDRYALAVAGSNEGIFDWDLVSDRVYVSYRAQELFGLPRGELWRPRRDWRHIVNFHPDDAPRLHDAIKAHIEGGAATYDEEFRIVLPDGAVRWYRQRGIALRHESGKAYRMVGSIGDVTEKHVVEEELRAMERKLRLAQRLESMGTLAGGIAHDFNNILGAILGYGEMALRDAPKGSRLRRDLDSIVTAGERGRALVDRVLAFSRSGVSERVPVNVEKVVREALDLVSAKLPPDVTLHAKLHAGSAAMQGDPTQVHQVLMNLASNAVQAMPRGGTLRVSLDAVRIEAALTPTIGSVAPTDYLVLKVADTGTGIAPEIIERIFDPFFTTKEVGTGTGLGLSLVHGIVAEVGGAIDVTSKVGAGSMFTVYLPRHGETVDNSRDEEPQLPRGEGQRVLIVDDEEPLVQLATRTLEELGYVPVGFTSSTKALAAFRADPQRFDAVITDERMPGMSGSALIREVRGIRDRIPIVLMSGFVGAAIGKRAREAGAEEVLKKPLSARDLAASLARVLHP